jgi:PKD repeat protein
VGGATVEVLDGPNAGSRATANSNGEYRFDSLAISNMNFRAFATGFTEDRRGTFVNGTNTLNFTLTPANATLRGTVRSSEGLLRLGDATVQIVSGPNNGRTTTTGSTGEYRFDNLTPGNTTVSARANNHDENRRDINLVDAENTLDFELRAQAPALSIVASQVTADATGAEFAFEARGNFESGSRFAWDFGDGGGVDGGRQREQHRYTVVGNFTVRVRVTPPGGTPLEASLVIEVRF